MYTLLLQAVAASRFTTSVIANVVPIDTILSCNTGKGMKARKEASVVKGLWKEMLAVRHGVHTSCCSSKDHRRTIKIANLGRTVCM